MGCCCCSSGLSRDLCWKLRFPFTAASTTTTAPIAFRLRTVVTTTTTAACFMGMLSLRRGTGISHEYILSKVSDRQLFNSLTEIFQVRAILRRRHREGVLSRGFEGNRLNSVFIEIFGEFNRCLKRFKGRLNELLALEFKPPLRT